MLSGVSSGPAASATTVGGCGLSSDASTAPGSGSGACPGAVQNDVPMVPERLLEELREFHNGTCRERSVFRRERAELNARLARLEHELRSEEVIGRDLMQRIQTLEIAIHRERQWFDGVVRNLGSNSSDADIRSAGGAGVFLT